MGWLYSLCRRVGIADAEALVGHWAHRGVDRATAREEARRIVDEMTEARGGRVRA